MSGVRAPHRPPLPFFAVDISRFFHLIGPTFGTALKRWDSFVLFMCRLDFLCALIGGHISFHTLRIILHLTERLPSVEGHDLEGGQAYLGQLTCYTILISSA
jgi:hypothetical protein